MVLKINLVLKAMVDKCAKALSSTCKFLCIKDNNYNCFAKKFSIIILL